jgi:cytolysin (calcineurin-like family phosphatase)
VTFFVFGDPQYGGGEADKDSFHIQALNAAPALVWPADAGFAGAGAPIGDPRGVVIAGDLTQNGQAGRDPLNEWYTEAQYSIDVNAVYDAGWTVPTVSAELGLFLRDYGLRGGDGLDAFVLKWRVFEGYGNHDFDILDSDPVLYGGQAPARDIVSVRNKIRATWPEIRRMTHGNAGHYSWDWDSTHFVHVNLVASDAKATNTDDDSGTQMSRDPQGALTFLQEDLAAEVGSSCRPVMVIMHYGFDAFSEEGRWWDEQQRLAFLDVLRPYNVVAILHGHVHETRAYTMSDAYGKSYDVFSLGSPFYTQGTNNGRGHFAVFHLRGTHIDAADVSWLPANPSPPLMAGKDLWTGKTLADLRFQTTTTFADGWGGWAFSKDIDPHACAAQDAGASDAAPGDAAQGEAGSCSYASGSYAQSCTGCATYTAGGVCVLGCESCTMIGGSQNQNPSVVLPCAGDVGNNDGTLVCSP